MLFSAIAPMSPTNALIAAIVVVVLVVVVWKFFKFAFKIALVVGAAILVYLALNRFGVI